jgi:NADH:ubiquinone oxidoreductase subunit 6 (subunit J)
MSISSLLLYFFMVMAAMSALALVFIKNVFYAALLLIACLLAIAGVYVLAFAEFLAVTQIMIYAGGVLVVIIFGIMLTSKLSGKALVVNHTNKFSGALVAATLFYIFIHVFSSANIQTSAPPPGDNVKQIGINLMTSFLLPFELAGVMLLVALIGAAVTASSQPSTPRQ